MEAASKPILTHPDFHTRNIFVDKDDPAKVTGLIDWPHAAVNPAFIAGTETPDFGELLFFDKELDQTKSQEQPDVANGVERCAKAWALLTSLCPKLDKGIKLDERLSKFFAGPHFDRIIDECALRSLLINLEDAWEKLGMPGVCPYQSSADHRKIMQSMIDERDDRHRMRRYLMRALHCDSDGWVAKEKWDPNLPVYRETYKEWVETCLKEREENETEAEARETADRLWPFDLR
ncbi:hypothetical protein B0A48_02639 [Cryoendolithus antarcticus]|uniref:Altered inheritance of mitochondria protein 9, mitochondrial n=1 Tax=Cryoendolithus antarcticus TaxID=1507870 RepID=A0A1V8TKU4_9PEZI|nr:hypothetical protein B0A48_02639 [Cryoendolithus antarcticus]